MSTRSNRPLDPRHRWSRAAGVVCLIGAALLTGACTQEPIDSADSKRFAADGGSVIDVGYQRADVSSPDAAPWPTVTDTSLPTCTRWSDAWALPNLAASNPPGPKGSLRLVPSAPLQPVGYEETLTISARRVDGSQDVKATGAVTLQHVAGVTVLHTEPLAIGTAKIRIKLTSPGAKLLKATLPDGRVGLVKLWGFVTQLPVWRVDVSAPDLTKLYSHDKEDIWVPITLHLPESSGPGDKPIITDHTGKMRLHGGSSRTFPKKSFRINLDKDQRLLDGRRKLILRAEYVDKTLVRNFTAYELFRHGSWLTTSRAQHVHLRLGATFHGVMLQPDRVDEHLLADGGHNEEGSLYEADPPIENSVPGGNLTVPKPPLSYGDIYQQHEGHENFRDLAELIEVVLRLSDAEFAANADRIIKVDDILVFLAVSALIQNQDWVKKNYYLYRDPAAVDSRWTIIPWDLDLSFGHLWTPKNDIFDEQIFTDSDPYWGTFDGHEFYNQLVDRLLWIKPFRRRYRSFLQHLLNGRFNKTFLAPRIDNALCRMQPDLLADGLKRAKNAEIPGRKQEIFDFIDARRAWLTTWLAAPDAMD